MLSTLTFVCVACLFADLVARRGGEVVEFVKSKF